MNFLKVIFIALLFCFNATAKSKKSSPGDPYLDSLITINIAGALKELSQVEDALVEEVIYLEGERYISVDELEVVFKQVLREEARN